MELAQNQVANSKSVRKHQLHVSKARPQEVLQGSQDLRRKVIRVAQTLRREYGEPKRKRLTDPLDELIRTILSQNTNDANRDRALASLRERFDSWEEVAAARQKTLEKAIRVGGLANIKSARIKKILRAIKASYGGFSLTFLRKLPAPEAREILMSFEGVGPKTAGCVLLFACGISAFPVDTHIYRVSKRLELIPERCTVERAHDMLTEMVPERWQYSLHLNMIQHGRKVCHPRRPACHTCVLYHPCGFRGGDTA